MSSRPPFPFHGPFAGVDRCLARECPALVLDRALRFVTPAAKRSSGNGPKAREDETKKLKIYVHGRI